MIEQLKTIRAGLETATCYSMLGVDAHSVQIALTALTQLEAMVGKQEPVAWIRGSGIEMLKLENGGCATVYASEGMSNHSSPLYAAPVAQQYEAGDMASAAAQGFRDGVASVTQQEPVAWAMPKGDGTFIDVITPAEHAREEGSYTVPLFAHPVAQQPQARPDFTDEWTGYLKDGETPFERFLRERKDVQSALKLYQRALEENERLKAQQPQAKPHKPLFADLIAQHPGLREELLEMDKQPQAEKPLAPLEPASSYVQPVPDHCDRIVWRNRYYHLPLKQPQAEAVPPDVVRDAERYRWLRSNQLLAKVHYLPRTTAESLDHAIDAAIAQQKGQP